MANVAHFMCEPIMNPGTWDDWGGKLPVTRRFRLYWRHHQEHGCWESNGPPQLVIVGDDPEPQ